MIADILTAREYIGQFDVPSQLSSPPGTHEAPARFYEPGLKAIFYDSVSYRGKPTRCFAWIGLPEGASKDNPIPGIVLIHGGGGTALGGTRRRRTCRPYPSGSPRCRATCSSCDCRSATSRARRSSSAWEVRWHEAWSASTRCAW